MNYKMQIADTKMFFRYVLVTPQLAEKLLEHNTNNRKLRRTKVDKISRDLRNGLWRETHQAIAFDTDEVLTNGQHRLQAIVKTGISAKVWICFNEPISSRGVIDDVVPRDASDMAQMVYEISASRQMFAVLKAMIAGHACDINWTKLELIETWPEHREAILFAMEHIRDSKGVSISTVRAVIARAFYTVDLAKLKQFSYMLSTGITPNEKYAALITPLRNLLQNKPGSRLPERKEKYGKVQRVLWAFLHDESISRVYRTQNEYFPLPSDEKIFGSRQVSDPSLENKGMISRAIHDPDQLQYDIPFTQRFSTRDHFRNIWIPVHGKTAVIGKRLIDSGMEFWALIDGSGNVILEIFDSESCRTLFKERCANGPDISDAVGRLISAAYVEELNGTI